MSTRLRPFIALILAAVAGLASAPSSASAIIFALMPDAEDCGVIGTLDVSGVKWVATCKTDMGTRVGTAVEGPNGLLQVQVTGPALDLNENEVVDLLDKASEIRDHNPGYADLLIDALLDNG